MPFQWNRYCATVLTCVALSFAGTSALAETVKQEKANGDGSLRVQDLPKPLPKMMEKIQEVGNEAGKGITKAGNAIGEAFNKAVTKGKEKER